MPAQATAASSTARPLMAKASTGARAHVDGPGFDRGALAGIHVGHGRGVDHTLWLCSFDELAELAGMREQVDLDVLQRRAVAAARALAHRDALLSRLGEAGDDAAAHQTVRAGDDGAHRVP